MDTPYVTSDEEAVTDCADPVAPQDPFRDLFAWLRRPDKPAGQVTDGPIVGGATPMPEEVLSWQTRQWLWVNSTTPAVRRCGRVRSTSDVTLRTIGGNASLAGLATCRSAWGCPTCWLQHSAETRSEILNAISTWTATGGRIAFVSLSLSRRKNRHLEPLWDLMTEAWDRTIRGQMWKKWMTDLASPGWIKTVEITRDKAWTPTLELVVFIGANTTEQAFQSFKQWLCTKWIRQIESLGSPRPAKAAQDALLMSDWSRSRVNLSVTLQEYMFQVVRTALSIYMARHGGPRSALGGSHLPVTTGDPTAKVARRDSAWSLLVGAVAGDEAMTRLWREFEQTSQTRKPIIWSHGLSKAVNDLAAPDRSIEITATPPPILRLSGKHTDPSDPATANLPVDEVIIPGKVWDHDVRTRPELIQPLLAAAAAGPSALREKLSEHRLRYRESPATMPDEPEKTVAAALIDCC